MTDYIPITEAETDPEAPSTSSLWKRWAKNWIAGFEGAAGAPRLQNAAIENGVIGAEKFKSGTVEAVWVGTMLGSITAGTMGAPSFLCQSSYVSTDIVANTNYAGSGLKYAGVALLSDGTSTRMIGAAFVMPGTWKALANATWAGNASRATMFIRVA